MSVLDAIESSDSCVFRRARGCEDSRTSAKNTKTYEIRRAAVIGAGTMGGGIAMNYANAGIPVIVKETAQEALDRGMATIRKNYANSVKKGRFSQAVMDQRMALITPQLTYDGFEQADIIVEAVFEGMALKKEIFGELDKIAKPDCILASNTSTLDIDEIASATRGPQMVIGHHFFSPANVMRLLEIVRGKATSKEVIATSMALAKKLNKVGVLAGNCRGFIGNRMIHVYCREAQFLVEEGAPVGGGGSDALRFRPGDGAAGDGRSGGARRRLAHPQGIQASGKARRAEFRWWPTCCAKWAATGRRPARAGTNTTRTARPTPDPEVAALIEKVAQEPASSAGRSARKRSSSGLHLRAGQRGRADSRRGHRAARGRYRYRLSERLRIPGVARRSDVLRGYRGAR